MIPVALPVDAPWAIALTYCPGRDGDLDGDVAAIVAWRATIVLSLVEDREFPDAPGLDERLSRQGIRWLRYPVADYGTPQDLPAWRAMADELRAALDLGGRLVIHCRAGLGRSGMIAARLLVERGLPAAAAIAIVRGARPGAIETAGQEAWIADPAAVGGQP
ncbi:dual specificity protein phosphatase family protein [Phreatobacter stygius]|uniref:Protein phosphatase n=1 Tax=Phreatobacter stygius TaxID=1940610 RepID=A0A4D7AYU5_9HYPH|nr:dual specificity protein phosphatase family protein [Phreatobacter stygius]QCI66654.1 protein phosphatase [Phreatobacter stygius]